mgnify:CR=1 FL=1
MKTRTWIVTGAGALASAGTVLAAPPPEPAAHEGSLKTIMVDLGQQMARVQTALWVEDLEAVSEAATQIADHPHVSPEERARVQAALGTDFAAFASGDRALHDGAVRLSEAASAKDLDATLRELGAVQVGCVSCHTQFRERLRVKSR